ncbi:unnamed protein product, partial [Candidula unifasciata]
MTSHLISGKEAVPFSTTHNIGKSKRRHGKIGAGLHKYAKQSTKRNGTEDFDRVIQFLKTAKGPQKTIAIAKACGYESKGQINPTLYKMEKKKLVEKTQERPPVWSLLPAGMNLPISASSLSHRGFHHSHSPSKQQQMQHININNHYPGRGNNYRGFRGRNRGRNRGSRGFKQNISNEARFRNNTLIDAEARSSPRSEFSRNESFSQGLLSSKDAALGSNLFTKSVNDTNAPGAYRV